MRVIVIGNVAHVIINFPLRVAENLIGNNGQALVQRRLYLLVRCGVVFSPHDHWYETDLTVRNPTQLVVEIALRDRRGLAQFAERH